MEEVLISQYPLRQGRFFGFSSSDNNRQYVDPVRSKSDYYHSGYSDYHSGYGGGGGGHYSGSYGHDLECCPLVVDPLTLIAILGGIAGATVFLNQVWNSLIKLVYLSKNWFPFLKIIMIEIMMRRRRRDARNNNQILKGIISEGMQKFVIEVKSCKFETCYKTYVIYTFLTKLKTLQK